MIGVGRWRGGEVERGREREVLYEWMDMQDWMVGWMGMLVFVLG